MALTVVVTGAAGHLAGAAAAVFREAGARVLPLDRRELDICDAVGVEARLRALGPHVVINGAAFNDVDAAEAEPHRALDVNAFGVRALARAAGTLGAVLVHYSTDFVFDGRGTQPYTEDDAPNPQSVYAASKLLGEWFALEAPGAYVLRVESLFGAAGRRSSLETIAAGIRAGDEVPVFTDRTVSPSYVFDVAAATRALVERRPPAGLYHCVNTGAATWEAVALEIGRQLGIEPRLRRVRLADLRLTAPRPLYCALSNAKLAAAGIPMPPWQDALARYLRGSVSGGRDAERGPGSPAAE